MFTEGLFYSRKTMETVQMFQQIKCLTITLYLIKYYVN